MYLNILLTTLIDKGIDFPLVNHASLVDDLTTWIMKRQGIAASPSEARLSINPKNLIGKILFDSPYNFAFSDEKTESFYVGVIDRYGMLEDINPIVNDFYSIENIAENLLWECYERIEADIAEHNFDSSL